jgi:hypothetical protein
MNIPSLYKVKEVKAYMRSYIHPSLYFICEGDGRIYVKFGIEIYTEESCIMRSCMVCTVRPVLLG